MVFYILIASILGFISFTIFNKPNIDSEAYPVYLMILNFQITWLFIFIVGSILYDKLGMIK